MNETLQIDTLSNENETPVCVLPRVIGSNLIVKVDDKFCEWEFGFTLDKKSIDDLIKAIEVKFKTKRNYSKLTRGFKTKRK
jgi:hypothetical protein